MTSKINIHQQPINLILLLKIRNTLVLHSTKFHKDLQVTKIQVSETGLTSKVIHFCLAKIL